MDHALRRLPALHQRTPAEELELIESAVLLVANRRSRRVVVAGLRHANEVLPEVRAAAHGLPIEIEVLERVDAAGPDVAIVRLDEDRA